MGQSGIEVSEVFPKLGEHVDEMAMIRSLWTDIPDHDIASRFLHTGSLQLPKPSLGSWVVYGLGNANQNMPGFISLGGKPEWRQASFLPGVFQGVNVNYSPKMKLDEVLLNIRNQFTPLEQQRRQIDLAHQLNAMHSERLHKDRAARSAHRIVRDGVQDADRGDRCVRHQQGIAGDARALHEPAVGGHGRAGSKRAGRARHEAARRAPSRRARRALRAGRPRLVGSSQ